MAEIYVTKFGVLVEYQETGVPVTTYVSRSGSQEKTLKRLPEAIAGYALDPKRSFWSIVVPEPTVNYCKNPSFEKQLINDHYTYTGWSVDPAISYAWPYATRGTYFAAATPTAGVEASMYCYWPYTEGVWTFSCDVFGWPGERIELRIRAGLTTYGRFPFQIDELGWNRYSVTLNLPGSGTGYADLIVPDTNTGKAICTDGWQVENKAYATTYADGDMIGHRDRPPTRSYFWRGSPHDSISERTAGDSLGGRPINFTEEANFKTTAIVGLGLPEGDIQENQVGAFQRTIHDTVLDEPRNFTITGKIINCTFDGLLEMKKRIEHLLRYDNTVDRDQVLLRWRLTDSRGDEYGRTLQIPVVYRGGMAGNITNFFQEDVGIQFRAAEPRLHNIYDSNQELAVNAYWDNSAVMYRDSTGHWQTLGSGTTYDLATSPDPITDCDFIIVPTSSGSELVPAVVGSYTVLAGSSIDYAAYWNGSSWTQIGSFNAFVERIAGSRVGDNRVFFGGGFTQNSAVTCRRAAVWTDTGISEMDDGLDDTVLAMVVGHDEWVYIGGAFAQDGPGVNTYNHIVQYYPDGDVMYPVDASNPGMNDDVWDMCITPDNWLWICGDFTTNTATTPMAGIAKMNLSLPYDEREFEAITASLTPTITNPRRISCAPDGSIYLSAQWSDTSTYEVRRWNGSSWEKIGSWDSVSSGHPYHWWGPDGTGYLSGQDYEIPNISQYYYKLTNINQLGPVDVDFIYDDLFPIGMAFHPDGSILTIAEGDAYTSSNTGAASTKVTNNGSSTAYPVIRILGPATLKCVRNHTTGSEIWFKHGDDFDAIISPSERMFIDLRLGTIRIYSDSRASIPNTIYSQATSINKFWLQPGDNYISLLLQDTTGLTEAHMIWKENYWSIGDSR